MGFFKWLFGIKPRGPYPIITSAVTGEVFNFNVQDEYGDRYLKSKHWEIVRTWSMADAVPRSLGRVFNKNAKAMPVCKGCGQAVTIKTWIGHHPNAEAYLWCGRERQRDVDCYCRTKCHPGRGTNHVRLHTDPRTGKSFVPDWASSRGIDLSKPGTIRKFVIGKEAQKVFTPEYLEYQRSLRK